MEKANLRKYFHIAHEVTWNLIKKLPEAFKQASLKVGGNLAETLKIDSHSLKTKATAGLLTLAALFGGSKISAQNYQDGQQVRLPGGFTGTIVKSSTQQAQRSQQSTISYEQAPRMAQSQQAPSGYRQTQSPLGVAQNVIRNKGLIVDAGLTEGLNREIYAYACYSVTNRNIIQLVQRNGSIDMAERGRCKSDQSGVCNAYCGEERHIGLEEAQQLAYARIAIGNHTDITRQAYNSAIVDEAMMDGAVANPRQEVQWYGRNGYHYDKELSTGIKWDSDIYQVMVKGRGEMERGVIIYKTPRYNEQTGIVSCAEEIDRAGLAELRSEAKGSKGNAGNYYQRGGHGYGRGGGRGW